MVLYIYKVNNLKGSIILANVYRTVAVTARNDVRRQDHDSMEKARAHVDYLKGAMFPTDEPGTYTTVQVAKIYETSDGGSPVEVYAWKKTRRG